jgi:hypothetical protein
MISDAAFCIGGKRIGEAWRLDENENSDAPQARIKANLFDIAKTPNAFSAHADRVHGFPIPSVESH